MDSRAVFGPMVRVKDRRDSHHTPEETDQLAHDPNGYLPGALTSGGEPLAISAPVDAGRIVFC